MHRIFFKHKTLKVMMEEVEAKFRRLPIHILSPGLSRAWPGSWEANGRGLTQLLYQPAKAAMKALCHLH